MERILEEIRLHGPLRFDRFQSLALYDPEAGYYQGVGQVGKSGDFVTGASWHPAFGRALGRIAEDLQREIGQAIDIVDVGAGEGELLASLRAACPDQERFRISGVELSRRRRNAAQLRAADAHLVERVEELPLGIDGLIVCYELFDALPVRALTYGEDEELLERLITIGSDGNLAWVSAPPSDGAELLTVLRSRGVTLQPGQQLEIRPGARAMARQLAQKLRRGLLLVFDYGARARALYGPTRMNGTLEAFNQHRVTRDVLSDPGQRDITSWVNFSEIEEVLEEEGMKIHGLVSQSRVLLASGIARELADSGSSAAASVERNAIAKLFMPGGMGESIRVLVAERGTAIGPSLIRFPEV